MKEKAFFIGWEGKPPATLMLFVRRIAIAGTILALITAAIISASQRTIGSGTFDWGNIQEYKGVFVKEPVPMLIADNAIEGEHIYYLVDPFKHGLSGDHDASHLKHVTIKGSLITDGSEAMIEVADLEITGYAEMPTSIVAQEMGESTIRGEIVDSKCHLGMMNPGRFKAHRACAILCIRGGIPPILVAVSGEGKAAHYLLVGANGQAINDRVLDFVAEPVEVTGQLRKVGDRLVLYADPNAIERL